MNELAEDSHAMPANGAEGRGCYGKLIMQYKGAWSGLRERAERSEWWQVVAVLRGDLRV